MSTKISLENKYKFTIGNKIGHGGNGNVYLVNDLEPHIDGDYVVKILSLKKWRNIETKKKRYNRFKKEIDTVLELQGQILGIMEIVDFYYPDDFEENEQVWYVMPKAQSFKQFNQNECIDTKKKLEYLIELCSTLCELHDKGYSHRDIKVDNILVLDDRLKLADFGLIFSVNDSRITNDGERVGPYYIGPPELESMDISIDDFRPSDVYLFSKLVWEIIKNDFIGFRGEYKRDNEFYLNPKEYGVMSFEPLHRLLEQSTKIDMSERIDINNCRYLLTEQLSIIEKVDQQKSLTYMYDELQMEVLNRHEPEERIYRDYKTIDDILRKFTPISTITILGANKVINATKISSWKTQNAYLFTSDTNSVLSYSYLFYPDYIKFTKDNEGIELYIKGVNREEIHAEFISFNELKQEAMWGIPNTNIFLDEPLVIYFEKKSTYV